MEARNVVGLFVSMAFLLHGVCMLTSGAYFGLQNKDKQNTVEAMLIIAFLLYFVAVLFSFLANFTSSMSEKTAVMLAGVLGAIAAVCTVIGVAIYNDAKTGSIHSYALTVYIVGACLGVIACVLAFLGVRVDA